MTGISALIAMKIVGSFALGWYLCGRSKGQNAARDKEQLQLALEALDRITRGSEKIVENHGSRLNEVSQELRQFSESEDPFEPAEMAEAADRIESIGQEMRDSLADLAREVMSELGIDEDDEPVAKSKGAARSKPSPLAVETRHPASAGTRPATVIAESTARSTSLATETELEADGVIVEDRENRGSERFSFEHTIHIAPRTTAKTVRRSDFHPMLGRDISVSGFSFFSETKPRFDHLVVAINGLDGDRIFAAEVVHATLIDTHYVVGCKFLERVMSIPH